MDTKAEFNELKKEWRENVLKGLCVVATLVFILEIVMFLILRATGHEFSCNNVVAKVLGVTDTKDIILPYTIGYIIFPTVVNFGSIGIAKAIEKSSKYSEKVKNYWVIIPMLTLCFTVATVHSYFIVTSAFFASTVIIACMMDDKRIFQNTMLISVLVMVLSIFVANMFDDSWTLPQRGFNVIVSIVLYLIICLVCYSVTQFGQRKNEIIRDGAIKEKEMKLALKVDAMTGLYNHSEFHKFINQKWDEKFVIVVMDVDNFKSINDTYGHNNGDQVLIRIATVISQYVNEYGKAFRYGGEEFAVILPDMEIEEAYKLMESVRNSIYSQVYSFLKTEHVSVSIGLAAHNLEEDANPSELFNKADEAMYVAKNYGRNYTYYAGML